MKTPLEIINFLTGYKGFDDWWDNIEEEDKDAILEELEEFLES